MALIPEKENPQVPQVASDYNFISLLSLLQLFFFQATVTQQFQPTQQMAIAPGNRNVKNLPVDSNGERDWSFGLLSCCGDCGACKYCTLNR